MHTVTPGRTETSYELAAWPLWVGKQVSKVSGKPFKSKEKVNTVSGITIHPVTGLHAFIFNEDDSAVECFRTVLISDKPSWGSAPSWALGLAFKCYGDPGEMGEWCWMSVTGSPGFICYETRPMTHIDFGDERVQEMIMNNYWRKKDQLDALRRAQSVRDRAKHESKSRVDIDLSHHTH